MQLENYELQRFWKLVPKSYSFSSLRQEVVWTPKAVTIANLALFFEFMLACVVAFFASSSGPIASTALVVFFVYLFFHFVFLSAATLCVAPFDILAKRRIVASARAALAKHPGMKVVAIAGSYGKTTMKEALSTVLSERFKTVMTPGNLNTPLGISRTILNDLMPDTEIFVVEMGEHYPGDLALLARLAPPDVVVVTGIGEAHLERFGTLDALVGGIFEVIAGVKEGGLVVLNADSTAIKENYGIYTKEREIAFYSSHSDQLSRFHATDVEFRDDGSGLSFLLSEKLVPVGKFDTALLGEYVVGIAAAALIVGERMGLTPAEVVRGFRKVKPVPHRLQMVPSGNGVLVIDDSYNGTLPGVRYAIETLARFTGRRKIYVTPGLVEAGTSAEAVHREIGRKLAPVADIVVLIKNSVTPFIANELEKKGFSKKDIRWFASAAEAHAGIADIVRTGDVILFQNDWPDNYT